MHTHTNNNNNIYNNIFDINTIIIVNDDNVV